jgi:hypothetical protein
MSGHSFISREAHDQQVFGLMGRLHMMLRRENGRVTDIKYMGSNAEYCDHVLALAAQTANRELQEISRRLREMCFGSNGVFANSGYRHEAAIPNASVRNNTTVAEKLQVEPDAAHDHSGEIEPSYVGRLR